MHPSLVHVKPAAYSRLEINCLPFVSTKLPIISIDVVPNIFRMIQHKASTKTPVINKSVPVQYRVCETSSPTRSAQMVKNEAMNHISCRTRRILAIVINARRFHFYVRIGYSVLCAVHVLMPFNELWLGTKI